MNLAAEEFPVYFKEVHGVPPFPWQARLARQVFETGEWPEALDVPTGAGKTAAIDIAVFHLALEAARGTERVAYTRTALVVDRRLVVDDAWNRAERIRQALRQGAMDVCRRVAGRLAMLAENPADPLTVVRLRGGLPREPDWVRTPAQPCVLLSTVDQIGSRLLFRGYGISRSMRPVHAGLLGVDTLLLLDEAHLSQPFVQTGRSVAALGDAQAGFPGRPLRMVTLSATQTASEPFQLTNQDEHDAVLGPRLKASKPTALVRVDVTSGDDEARRFAELAFSLSRAGEGDASVVGVVVNRVRRARSIFAALETAASARGMPGGSVALLTGRARPLDRGSRVDALLPRIRAGRTEQEIAPLFVVATQCIEAGADLDFDALVTEIAPLDCLRQRFGRLNRLGRGITARGVVVALRDQLTSKASDPIYGQALSRTWKLLDEKSRSIGRGKGKERVIDFGIEPSRAWLPEGQVLLECLAPRADAPIMLPRFADFLSHTSPEPHPDPEPALFLHGPRAGRAEVSVVWRADLADDEEAVSSWKEQVTACPPSGLEALPLPVREARRWLEGRADADIADTESEAQDDVAPRSGRHFLRWAGDESVLDTHVRPGDVVVVPAARGGCDEWGWNPVSVAPVMDLGRRANQEQRARDIVRLHSALFDGTQRAEIVEFVRDAATLPRTVIIERLRELSWLSPGWSKIRPSEVRLLKNTAGTLLAVEVPFTDGPTESHTGKAATEDDEGSLSSVRRVLLADHSKGVEAFAARFASQVGLPNRWIADFALTGFLHDAGKAHPDFKQYLYGGDEVARADRVAALAKSDQSGLRNRGRLPRGARHEAASIRFALAHPRLADARDRDLVLWLIGTHHGHGRPFFPPVEWPRREETFSADLGDGVVISRPGPQVEDLADGWVDLFWRLCAKYGPWRLAWFEAVLRLADHRCSEAEQNSQ